MDHTHGVTVSLESKVALAITVHQVVNGLVLLEGNISDEVQFKFHSKLNKSIYVLIKFDELVVSNYVYFEI